MLSNQIELDDRYAVAGGYRVLGSLYWKLPGIVGGSDSEAEKYLKLALEREAKPLNYLFYANFLVEQKNNKVKALEVVNTALSKNYAEKLETENLESIPELKALKVKLEASHSLTEK